MREDFLHYVWRMRQFDLKDLRLVDGRSLDIIEFGHYNTHSGPDFLNARIRIEDTVWAGNIEMHLSSSGWQDHRHDKDPAYDSVILHVVMDHDMPVTYTSGKRIPCLEIKSRVYSGILASYRRLMAIQRWIPCQNQLHTVPDLTKLAWMERMMVERLEVKTAFIGDILVSCNLDWEETAYHALARSFGFHVNGDAFMTLASRLPLKLLMRHRDDLQVVEALCFGCAGMLNMIFTDPYPVGLQKEFDHLMHKYDLSPMHAHQWRWMRMRPANFPSVRIAQFARFFSKHPRFFQKLLESPLEELLEMFDLTASQYWDDHVRFDLNASKRKKRLGKISKYSIVINTVVPFLFYYGRMQDQPQFGQRAMALLEGLPVEKNTITRKWASLDMPAIHAGHSQALMHLKKAYCENYACLRCAIGEHIVSNS